MVQEKITEADTPPRGRRHSIGTNQRPASVIPIFMPDALPATTLPLYPGLEEGNWVEVFSSIWNKNIYFRDIFPANHLAQYWRK